MRIVTAISACLLLIILAAPVAAQDDHPAFSGTWQLDTAKSDIKLTKTPAGTWVIQEGDNSIRITETETGKNKKIELQCTTDGKECKAGGDRRASFWYNGATLVEMETKSDHVVRYRLKMSDDGKTLTVEITQLVPQNDKIDTLVFQKQS